MAPDDPREDQEPEEPDDESGEEEEPPPESDELGPAKFRWERAAVVELLAWEVYDGRLVPTREQLAVLVDAAGLSHRSVRTPEKAVSVAAALLGVPAHEHLLRRRRRRPALTR
jgi:hypothetical protein